MLDPHFVAHPKCLRAMCRVVVLPLCLKLLVCRPVGWLVRTNDEYMGEITILIQVVHRVKLVR